MNAPMTSMHKRQVELLHGFGEKSEGILYWPDVSKDEQYWSPGLKALLEYSAEEIDAGYSVFRSLLHPDDEADVAYAMSEHLNNNEPLNIDCRLRTRSGQYRWFQWAGSSSRIHDIRHMTCLVCDVHERKTDEMALKQFQSLVSSPMEFKQKIRCLLDFSKSYLGVETGVLFSPGNDLCEMTVDDESQKALVVDSLKGVCARFSTIAKTMVIRHCVGEDRFSKKNMDVGSFIGAPIIINDKSMGILLLFSKEQRSRMFSQAQSNFVAELCQWLSTEFERELGWQALEFDNRRLGALVDELEKSNHDLKFFAATAFHDLCEPLGTVSAFTELLHREYKGKLDQKGDEYLDFTRSGLQRIRYLLEGLRDYALCSSETESIQSTDLQHIVNEVCRNLNELITREKAEINYQDLPEVKGEPLQYLRLLQNLIANAIKYRQKNIRPRINVTAREKADAWQICVEDNGIGMEQHQLDDVFEPFARLHAYADYHGTGLGLAICKKTVEMLGGEVWAESEPGKGSAFYFSVPK